MQPRVKPTKKQARQGMILKIIKDSSVATQDDLKRSLTKFGFDVTQSSLSRDIAELGLMKQHGRYIAQPSHTSTPQYSIVSMESSGSNMIVVKTVIGMAAHVGSAIDNSRLSNVIGTVAGDDTVFVATAQGTPHGTIKQAINKLFKGE